MTMTNRCGRGHKRAVLLLLVAVVSVGLGLPATANQTTESGKQSFQRGAFDEAIARWQKAIEKHHRDGDSKAEVRAMVSLATAYQSLGHHQRAQEILEQAVGLSEKTGDRRSILLAKSRLGAACILTLRHDRAGSLLRESLAMAQSDADPAMTAAIHNDLGNLLAAQGKGAEALAAYRESAALARKADNRLLAAQALSNAASIAARDGNAKDADALNAEAIEEANKLDDSHDKAFLLLTAALTDRQIKSDDAGARRLLLRAQQSLQRALDAAEKIGDQRAASYALGYMGQLYEQDKQLDHALALTRRAAFVAQQADVPEALFRWEWQTGRVLSAQGKADEAIAAYRRAVHTLQPIRHDISLGYGNATAHPSFREAHGPLFFQLSDLLLRQAAAQQDPAKAQPLLLEARDTVEQLKTVELEDYFQDDCVNVLRSKTKSLEAVDAHTAVVYLVPLPTRTEVLVSLKSGIKQFTVNVGVDALTAEVREFRNNLETRATYGYLTQAQQLYDWLIRPIHGLLVEHKIDTLVFVPDGALQTIPFATLHDGKRFLIQEFAVAAAPGLSLIDPRPVKHEGARLLLSGLSKPVQGFPPLDFVPTELDNIERLYNSPALLNEQFVLPTFRRKLIDGQYSIVHIASHGQFSRDVRDTFVLTYDGKLTLNELEALIRPSQYRGRPVEMLILSACQTAAGDDRAALGLAGVAVKAGARSAMATLWFVNDQSTSVLVAEVYQQLRSSPSITKARALQAAQIKLLSDKRYRHPCYWSPYLIIGNWL